MPAQEALVFVIIFVIVFSFFVCICIFIFICSICSYIWNTSALLAAGDAGLGSSWPCAFINLQSYWGYYKHQCSAQNNPIPHHHHLHHNHLHHHHPHQHHRRRQHMFLHISNNGPPERCLDASYADFYNFSLNLERKKANGIMDKNQ